MRVKQFTSKIPLTTLQKISRDTPERMDEFLAVHGTKSVRIWSDQWKSYWRSGRCGYTDNSADAGIYTMAEAWDATFHCGPEKQIIFKKL